jgi:electron transfer flavoprotein alpha subunit
MGTAVIYAEHKNETFKKTVYESIQAAKIGGASSIIVLTCGDKLDFAEKLKACAVDKIIALEDPFFQHLCPEACAKVLADEIGTLSAELILFPHTAQGKDLAPRVAAHLNISCATDAIEIKNDGGNFLVTRYAYSGKTLQSIRFTKTPALVTLRPGSYPPAEKSDANVTFEKKSPGLSEDDVKIKTTGISQSSDKIDISEAETVVSGGRGLKEAENFKFVEELAEVLGAAVGASRAVVDAGWRPHSEQVGQTGKTVSPTLYIAVGISGAIQHLAGMDSSKVIVAINNDKDAPIFKVADYGIVGDALEVLPALTAALKGELAAS